MARSGNVRRNPFRTCRRRRLATSNEDARSWENLPQDILMVIVMKLGLFDFLAFSSVCKSWRSEALSNRSTFFTRKEPLLMNRSNKLFTFTNIFDEGRRYSTDLGTSSSGGYCVGVSCGYLIIRRRKHTELYLVNPFTRHELYFPPLPENGFSRLVYFRAILVYSSWLSKPLLVMLCRGDIQNQVMYSGPGDSEWVVLPIPDRGWRIVDLAFCKGKIYLLNNDSRMGEMKLKDGLSSLELLDLERKPSLPRELVSSGERLFMVDHPERRVNENIIKREFDFEKMKWVLREEGVGEESLFVNSVKSSAVVKTSNWLGHRKTQYESIYILPYIRNRILPYGRNCWYFPHECYTCNLLTDS